MLLWIIENIFTNWLMKSCQMSSQSNLVKCKLKIMIGKSSHRKQTDVRVVFFVSIHCGYQNFSHIMVSWYEIVLTNWWKKKKLGCIEYCIYEWFQYVWTLNRENRIFEKKSKIQRNVWQRGKEKYIHKNTILQSKRHVFDWIMSLVFSFASATSNWRKVVGLNKITSRSNA